MTRMIVHFTLKRMPVQGNVKVRLNPVKKILLNPPLKRGVGGILKSKVFHIKIIMLDVTLT